VIQCKTKTTVAETIVASCLQGQQNKPNVVQTTSDVEVFTAIKEGEVMQVQRISPHASSLTRCNALQGGRASDGAGAVPHSFALLASEAVIVKSGASAVCRTGIRIKLPANTFARLCPNTDSNAVPLDRVLDSQDTNEVRVMLVNRTQKDIQVSIGDRIARLVLQSVDWTPETVGGVEQPLSRSNTGPVGQRLDIQPEGHRKGILKEHRSHQENTNNTFHDTCACDDEDPGLEPFPRPPGLEEYNARYGPSRHLRKTERTV
jgi:dUTPase